MSLETVLRSNWRTLDVQAHEWLGEAKDAEMHSRKQLAAAIASIVHEINQPLSGTLCNIEMCVHKMKLDSPDIASALEAAERCLRDSKRVIELVHALRELFVRKSVNLCSCDLNEIVHESLREVGGATFECGIELRKELDSGMSAVHVDRLQIRQVINNLIHNAVESFVAVTDQPRSLLIKTWQKREAVGFSVKDSGIGIGPVQREKAFDPFYTTKNGGTGMGLYLSHAIIQAHQGAIWIENNAGPGSIVGFEIPCRSNSYEEFFAWEDDRLCELATAI